MIKFRCLHCGCKLGVPDEFSGRRVRCTKCNEVCEVPALDSPEDSGVAMELDPEPVDEWGGDLKLTAEDAEEFSAEDLLRQKMIAQAGRQRMESVTAGPGGERRRRSNDDDYEEIGEGNFWLAVLCSVGAALIVTAIWVVVFGNMQARLLVGLEILVPLAAAAGLGVVLRRSGVLIGVLAVLIGMLSILGGKYVLAKRYFEPRIMLELSWSINDNLMGYFGGAMEDKDMILNMVVGATLGSQGVVDPNLVDVIGMAYAVNIKYDIDVPEFEEDVAAELEKIEANVADMPDKKRYIAVKNNWYGMYRYYLRMFLESDEGRGYLFSDALKMAFSAYDVLLLPLGCFLAFRMCWKKGVGF